jgi:DnaJ-class molecular chaperone
VEVQVAIPTHLGGEEKKLLQKLNELQQEKARKHQHRQEQPSLVGKFMGAFAGGS